MVEEGDLKLTSSYRHTRTITAWRTTVSENKLNPVEQLVDIKMGGEGRDPVSSGHMPLAQQPTSTRDITTAVAHPKEQGIRAPCIRLPSPGNLHREDKPLFHLL